MGYWDARTNLLALCSAAIMFLCTRTPTIWPFVSCERIKALISISPSSTSYSSIEMRTFAIENASEKIGRSYFSIITMLVLGRLECLALIFTVHCSWTYKACKVCS